MINKRERPAAVIGKPVLNRNTVITNFNISPNLKRCFRSFEIYADYGERIKADQSILSIPAISSILTLLWVAGGDIYVDTIDKDFAQSMSKLQQVFSKMPFTNIPFDTKIYAKKFVENKTSSEETALFFSGGLDSSYSLFRHIKEKPRLLTVLGFDIWRTTQKNERIWNEWRTVYSKFAEQEGVKINFIRTNTREVMREGRVEQMFNNHFPGVFWTALRHMPMLLGLGAPLSIGRFNKLIVSGTRDPSRRPETHPFCSYPETDEVFGWADLHIEHCGYITRREKIGFLKNQLQSGRLFGFRPCWHDVEGLNCNKCEKCYRTIVALVLQGIDPNICGLKANLQVFENIKKFITGVSEPALHDGSNVYVGYWHPMKQAVPDEITEDIHGSKAFLEWFRDIKI